MGGKQNNHDRGGNTGKSYFHARHLYLPQSGISFLSQSVKRKEGESGGVFGYKKTGEIDKHKKAAAFRKNRKLPLLRCAFLAFQAFHKIHDLFVAGTNFFYRYIMIDDIDDACHVFAHICFYIIWFFQKLRDTVI